MLRRGIVVTTCPAHLRTWLPDCVESIGCDVTVVSSVAGGYEAAGLYAGVDRFDEFWLLPDSVVVHDRVLLAETLNEPGAVSLGSNYFCCIGKYVTEHVLAQGLPTWPWTKAAAVDVELGWASKQAGASGARVLDAGFADGDQFEVRHGRQNMVLRSSLLTKYKGTWLRSMIEEA